MPHILILLAVWVLLFNGESQKAPIYPHLLEPTKIHCKNTDSCLEHYHGAWCKSGTICYKGLCHLIPAYPCQYTEICDERSKQCIRQNCSSWADCDDGIFCNGAERCVAGQCRSDYKFDCSYGICSEEERKCVIPSSLREKNQQRLKDVFTPLRGVKGATTKLPIVGKEGGLSQKDITTDNIYAIIGVVAGVLGILVIFMFFTRVRPEVEPMIIIDRGGRGTSSYGEEYTTSFNYS